MFDRSVHPAIALVAFVVAAVVATKLSLDIARHGVAITTTLAAGFGIFAVIFTLLCGLASRRD